jgi:hypothetical protein
MGELIGDILRESWTAEVPAGTLRFRSLKKQKLAERIRANKLLGRRLPGAHGGNSARSRGGNNGCRLQNLPPSQPAGGAVSDTLRFEAEPRSSNQPWRAEFQPSEVRSGTVETMIGGDR